MTNLTTWEIIALIAIFLIVAIVAWAIGYTQGVSTHPLIYVSNVVISWNGMTTNAVQP